MSMDATAAGNGNHDRFLRHLDASLDAVFQAARWFVDKGISVRVAGVHRAESAEQWREYADVGDLFIEKRIEVKHLSRHFTCQQDWPFGSDFIVCGKESWDRADPKPHGFMILNDAMTHAAFVLGGTVHRWRAEWRTDRRYNNVRQEYYLCPLSDVQFKELG